MNRCGIREIPAFFRNRPGSTSAFDAKVSLAIPSQRLTKSLEARIKTVIDKAWDPFWHRAPVHHRNEHEQLFRPLHRRPMRHAGGRTRLRTQAQRFEMSVSFLVDHMWPCTWLALQRLATCPPATRRSAEKLRYRRVPVVRWQACVFLETKLEDANRRRTPDA